MIKKSTKTQILKAKKLARKSFWTNKFSKKIVTIHKQFTKSAITKILNRIDRAIYQIKSRSKKHNVEFNLSVEQLRKLTYDCYGTNCLFCDKIITISNYVYDHIIPVAKGGKSVIDNLQLLCKSCNTRKGSLDQDNFKLLLDWLDTMPLDFKNDVLTKLSGGRR